MSSWAAFPCPTPWNPPFLGNTLSTGQRWCCDTLTMKRGVFNIHTKHNCVYFQLFPLKQVMRWKVCVRVGWRLGRLTATILAPYSCPPSSKEQKMVSLRSPAWSDRISKRHCHRQALSRGWDVWPGALADREALGVAGNSCGSRLRVPHWPLRPWASSQSLGTWEGSWITHKTEGLFLKPCRPDSERKCRLGKWRKGCWDSTVY